MADLTDITSAESVKIIGSDATGVEQTPVQSTLGGGLHFNLRSAAGSELLGRQFSTLAVPVIETESLTYSASIFGLSAASSATDIFVITGSASKTIRVQRIIVNGTRTSATPTTVLVIKRSSDNTGGTFSSPTKVAHDSNNSAATAVVRAYTANPSSLGTAVGTAKSRLMVMGTTNPSGAQSFPAIVDFVRPESQPMVLRGTSEILAINLNATTIAGSNFYMEIEWTEE